MAEIAADLGAWAHLGQTPQELDVTEIAHRFRLKAELELAEEDLLQQRKELALAAARKVQQLAGPLNDALRKVHPRAEIDRLPDEFADTMLFAIHVPYGAVTVFKFGRMSRLSSGSGPLPLDLVLGYGIELTDDGLMAFRAFVHLGLRDVMDTRFDWNSTPAQAPVGSVEMDRVLEAGMTGLASGLRDGLEAFVANTPGR